jgi:hypothetical protein
VFIPVSTLRSLPMLLNAFRLSELAASTLREFLFYSCREVSARLCARYREAAHRPCSVAKYAIQEEFLWARVRPNREPNVFGVRDHLLRGADDCVHGNSDYRMSRGRLPCHAKTSAEKFPFATRGERRRRIQGSTFGIRGKDSGNGGLWLYWLLEKLERSLKIRRQNRLADKGLVQGRVLNYSVRFCLHREAKCEATSDGVLNIRLAQSTKHFASLCKPERARYSFRPASSKALPVGPTTGGGLFVAGSKTLLAQNPRYN